MDEIRDFAAKTPKPMGKVIRIRDGHPDILGIDYGNGLSVHALNDSCIVIKVPGQSRWSGIGQRKYEPPSLLIFAITERMSDTSWSVEPLAELSLAKGKS